MARTSAKAKKSKQEVNKKKEEAKQQESKNGNDTAGDSTDKENDSVNYDVEKITHTRIYKGKRQYLVRWKGYAEDNDTWETESALQNCKEALETFKNENLIDPPSDEEGEQEEVADEEKNKSKSSAKKVKKSAKKSGKFKKPSKKLDIEEDLDPEEEETKELKDQNNEKADENTEDSDVDSTEKTKAKGTKGKKRNAPKQTENSKAKKTKKDESDDESVTDGKDYEVEKIIEVHTRKDGSREFLVRWKGYKPSEDTWEPEAHLDCQDLIDKFMEKVEKARGTAKKELRENRKQTKRFVPLNSMANARRNGLRGQRNSGLRPCYQETYED